MTANKKIAEGSGTMFAIKSGYGRVIIQEDTKTEYLDLNKFSFNTSRKLLESYKGSLSDAIIEERRGTL
jgi:hypothetical protein